MIVHIRSTNISLLAIFIGTLVLCIQTPAIISTDPVDEKSIISPTTNENNQTIATIDEHTPQPSDNALSDSNSDVTPPELPSSVDNDAPTILAEDKSETLNEVLAPVVLSSSSVDNQTSDDQQTTSSSTKKNLSNINSFEEWKQQQLHADILKKDELVSQNGALSDTSSSGLPNNIQQIASSAGASKKGKLRKNFASGSCGAKILAHNTEAQNVPSILSSSPDEYMLNPCNAKIWFVIELCESIRILNIEIANFELFSSVPKTLRVSASDRYPTKDWHRHHLGTFNASFNRTIQSFQTLESTTYLKYVKFELLDFHGHEHYCPLSVVRIHGSNVEDEIMTMEENTNSIDLNTIRDMEDENDNEEDDLNNDQQVGGIIGSAILDLAKRVFRRQTIRGTPSTTSMPIIETNVLKNNCHQTVLNGSLTNNTIIAWRQSDTFKQCIAEFLQGLWFKFDTCTTYLTQICWKLNYCCQCPSSIIRFPNASLVSTLNIYNHPCGYYYILTNQFICQKDNRLNETISTNLSSSILPEISEKNVTREKNDTINISDESLNSSNNLSTSNLTDTVSNLTLTPLPSDRSNEQPSSNSTTPPSPDEAALAVETQIPSKVMNQSSSQSSTPETIDVDFNLIDQVIDTNTGDEPTLTTTTTTTTAGVASASASTLNTNDVIPPIISSPWLKGMLVNTKSLPELFKIIEKLNFNLTLSNRYLQELSQHYVKKLDETQQTTDLLLKASKAADKKLETFEEHLYKLQEDFRDASFRLMKLEAWLPLIVCIIICSFIWCIWSTCCLLKLRRRYKLIIKEFEKTKTIKPIEDDEELDDPVLLFNGIHKRKLSTDSSDSNPTRSQRVPDLTLSKIKENGIDKMNHTLKKNPGNQTPQLPTLSTSQV